MSLKKNIPAGSHQPSPLRQSSQAEDASQTSSDASPTSAGGASASSLPLAGFAAPGPTISTDGVNSASTIAAVDVPDALASADSHFMIGGLLAPEDTTVHRAWTPDSAISRSPAMSYEETSVLNAQGIPISARLAKGRLASLKASPSNTPTIANSWEEVPQGSFDIGAFESFDAMDIQLEIDLKEQLGWRIEKCAEDGNCLFRSLSDQLTGNQNAHMDIRQTTMDYMVANRDNFAPFIVDSEPFDHYIARKRKAFTFANDLEISAAASALRRKIELYRYSPIPFLTYQPEPPLQPEEDHEPLRISYQRSNHYNSIRTSLEPSTDVPMGDTTPPETPLSSVPPNVNKVTRVNSDGPIFDMEVDSSA